MASLRLSDKTNGSEGTAENEGATQNRLAFSGRNCRLQADIYGHLNLLRLFLLILQYQ